MKRVWISMLLSVLGACGAQQTSPANTDQDDDGVEDFADECISVAEDLDAFEDDDGCPETDNDHDRILDVDDACPNEAEDIDRFEDEDGCPDPDNDGDTILDVDDTCPCQAEVHNGYEDEDGCPDSALVLPVDTEIRILEKVFFERGSAVPPLEATTMLGEIAQALAEHPEIHLVALDGHAAPREANPHPLALARAEAVRDALLQLGVEAERLTVREHGRDLPLVANDSAEGRATNRRVEFNVEDYDISPPRMGRHEPHRHDCP